MVHRKEGKTQRFLYSILTGGKINNSHFLVRFYFYRIKTTPFKVEICFYFNLLRKSHINNSHNNYEITHIWKGSRMGSWKIIKNNSINEIRAQDNNDVMDGGWHFSYMGGLERVKQKIEASSAIEWNNDNVINNLEKNLKEEKDAIFRGDYLTKVNIDETYPQYFLDNLDKFKYLIKE